MTLLQISYSPDNILSDGENNLGVIPSIMLKDFNINGDLETNKNLFILYWNGNEGVVCLESNDYIFQPGEGTYHLNINSSKGMNGMFELTMWMLGDNCDLYDVKTSLEKPTAGVGELWGFSNKNSLLLVDAVRQGITEPVGMIFVE